MPKRPERQPTEFERPHEPDAYWAKQYHVVVDRGIWATLSPKAKAVYPVLLRHLNQDRRCWPSVEVIAREAGIHPRNVSVATKELEARQLIKKWRHGRGSFYYAFGQRDLERLLPGNMDVNTPPQIMDVSAPEKSRDRRGRFTHPPAVEEPSPRSVEAVHPAGMDAKKNREEELLKKNETAGSASALAGACASPAPTPLKEDDGSWLLPGKLPKRSFYYQQRQCKAFDKPTPEFIRWLRTCVLCTESELQSVLASEYPSWKGPKDVP